jgi:hypothetical protein
MNAPTFSTAVPFVAGRVVHGRYSIFHAGAGCGEDRWRIEHAGDHLVVTGEQALVPPHPFPNRQQYRATLSESWRPLGLEVLWEVGGRRLRATHAADGALWRVRLEYDGHVHEQEGDFPEYCEVEFTTPLFNTFILARRDFAEGGEHEFPVLRIGPPHMAVTPDRMRYRCVERGEHAAPGGPTRAKRYVLSLPPRGEDEGYTFWADEDGFVLETYEGPEPHATWMKLVECRVEDAAP